MATYTGVTCTSFPLTVVIHHHRWFTENVVQENTTPRLLYIMQWRRKDSKCNGLACDKNECSFVLLCILDQTQHHQLLNSFKRAPILIRIDAQSSLKHFHLGCRSQWCVYWSREQVADVASCSLMTFVMNSANSSRRDCHERHCTHSRRIDQPL